MSESEQKMSDDRQTESESQEEPDFTPEELAAFELVDRTEDDSFSCRKNNN